MSNMKRWLREKHISHAALAIALQQSAASITQKVNGKTPWQYSDRLKLNKLFGLSGDFIDDFIPYEKEFPNPQLSSLRNRDDNPFPLKENALSQVAA